MATPFMYLNLPTPSVTLGPAWASQLNTALETIDAHDHSNGKGTTIKTAGIEINDDLNFNSFRVFGLKSVKLSSQVATLSGNTNSQSLFSYAGDLWYTSSLGIPVQITSGSSIISTPSALTTITYTPVAASVYTATGSDVLLAVDTTSPRTINLPACTAYGGAGRVYIIKDQTGNSETNNITITPNGSDLIDGVAGSTALMSNFGSIFLVSNGLTGWVVI